MAAEEFIRRFLLHVLPAGFQRIRYYGFLGNRYRKEKLARCRHLLGMPAYEAGPAQEAAPDYRERYQALTGVSLRQCCASPRYFVGTGLVQRQFISWALARGTGRNLARGRRGVLTA